MGSVIKVEGTTAEDLGSEMSKNMVSSCSSPPTHFPYLRKLILRNKNRKKSLVAEVLLGFEDCKEEQICINQALSNASVNQNHPEGR